MGYHTDLNGQFEITRALDRDQVAYLQKFCQARRKKRDESKLKEADDPLREAVGLPIGEDGEFYVGGEAWFEIKSAPDLTIANSGGRPLVFKRPIFAESYLEMNNGCKKL